MRRHVSSGRRGARCRWWGRPSSNPSSWRRVRALLMSARLPREGESVVVVGNPLWLEGSVSNGIISAVRDIPNFGHLIKITAAISPGSSGSPVVDLAGRVLGVATLQFAVGRILILLCLPNQVRLRARSLITLAALNRETQRERRAKAEKLYREGVALRFLSQNICEKAMPYFEKAVEADASYADPWAQIGYCMWKSSAYWTAKQ